MSSAATARIEQKYESSRPTRRSLKTAPVGVRQDPLSTARRERKRDTIYLHNNEYKSPYSEPLFTLSGFQGKVKPKKHRPQHLKPTVINGHIPTGHMQKTVVVTRSIDSPQQVPYRVRAKHSEKYDRDFNDKLIRKYSKKFERSPYKMDLSELRAISVLSTIDMLNKRDEDWIAERKQECLTYRSACSDAYAAERRYPKSDLIYDKDKRMRVAITE